MPANPANPLRIAFIGAGSVGFTRKLMADILTVPELVGTEFAFHDIDAHNLDMVAQLCRKEIDAHGLPATVTATTDRREALDGAKYVVNCTRIGGLDAFKDDIDIPLQYGIDQCVGDTLCAGGIMYGQRNIPQILAFQKDMAELCADDALFLNYANPMAMNTWAALDAHDRGEGIDTLGLCHGVQGGWKQIAETLAHYHGDEDIDPMRDVDIIAAGINHQTWYVKILYKGRAVQSDELLAAYEAHPENSETEKVRIDVLRRFGYYSTESNGHLSEYIPWYRKRPNEINDWISLKRWITGETGGYLRICQESRHWFETDFPEWLEKAGQEPLTEDRRSHEHGSWIIEALETGRTYRGHFNVRNNGAIANLPDDCIVEVPGYVDATGVHIPRVGKLPLACAATCQASVDVQRMAKEAAVNADVTLLKQAMLHDPLTAAVCNPEEIWQMTDHMLVAQRQWLPQFEQTGAIDAAAQRLAAHEKSGTRVERSDWLGAARLPVRSLDQIRAGASAAMLDADKDTVET